LRQVEDAGGRFGDVRQEQAQKDGEPEGEAPGGGESRAERELDEENEEREDRGGDAGFEDFREGGRGDFNWVHDFSFPSRMRCRC